MNLPFLKLELAGSPWLLFDRTGRGPAASRLEPDWPAAARGVCGRARGASGDGIIVAEVDGDGVAFASWAADGAPCGPPPAAVLCASRWLFDRGSAGPESVVVRSPSRVDEALVIDSRNFGLSFGEPRLAGEDTAAVSGRPEAERVAGAGIGLGPSADRRTGGMVVSVVIAGAEVAVTLRDARPAPAPASRRRGASPGVEAFVAARHEIRLRARNVDPVAAAAAAVAAAVMIGYCDRDAAAMIGGERLTVQWPEGEALFVAGAPAYCLSGEFWAGQD